MNFNETYTTETKITADTKGKEAKKTKLSEDAFAIGNLLEQVFNKLEHLRISIIR